MFTFGSGKYLQIFHVYIDLSTLKRKCCHQKDRKKISWIIIRYFNRKPTTKFEKKVYFLKVIFCLEMQKKSAKMPFGLKTRFKK